VHSIEFAVLSIVKSINFLYMNIMPIAISVVIPVYRGQYSLPILLAEFAQLSGANKSPNGVDYAIKEILLVYDCGPDDSDATIEKLAKEYSLVRPIWLTRNYGQHPATLAGMASSTGDWVVTMDEDGQQNPADIGKMLDIALSKSLQIVYARPINPPPHGNIRNICSNFSKRMALKLLGSKYKDGAFNSFRLINGEIARVLAAYCGDGVYLDIGLFWIAGRVGHCSVQLRAEGRPSSYSFLMLLNHFWRMVIASGTRPLRIITIAGFFSIVLALFLFVFAFYGKFYSKTSVQGWTSILVIMSFFSGLIMVSLGIVAEYLAMTMGILMGKPLYVIASSPSRSAKK